MRAASSLKQLQGPLVDKLKSAVQKEEDLKSKLKEQAVKFEMFQVSFFFLIGYDRYNKILR